MQSGLDLKVVWPISRLQMISSILLVVVLNFDSGLYFGIEVRELGSSTGPLDKLHGLLILWIQQHQLGIVGNELLAFNRNISSGAQVLSRSRPKEIIERAPMLLLLRR